MNHDHNRLVGDRAEMPSFPKEDKMTTPTQADNNEVLLQLGHANGYYQALADVRKVMDEANRCMCETQQAETKWAALEMYINDNLKSMKGEG